MPLQPLTFILSKPSEGATLTVLWHWNVVFIHFMPPHPRPGTWRQAWLWISSFSSFESSAVCGGILSCNPRHFHCTHPFQSVFTKRFKCGWMTSRFLWFLHPGGKQNVLIQNALTLTNKLSFSLASYSLKLPWHSLLLRDSSHQNVDIKLSG